MKQISKEELITLLDDFLCDSGLAYKFVDFYEKKGYSVKEIEDLIVKCSCE